MGGTPFRSLGTALFLSALLASPASAHLYIVGPGSGADYPNLPTAIAAAHDGDVLLVRSASYSGGFTLDKGLTIIGYGTVSLSGAAQVRNIPAGRRATIVHLSAVGVTVDACNGRVVLEEIVSTDASTVTTCADVRFFQFTTPISPSPSRAALTVSDARVEVVDSTLTGSSFTWPFDFGSQDGGAGLVAQPGSRIHFARSNAAGGHGQGNLDTAPRGNAAPAILLPSTAEVIVAGAGSCYLNGNFGGETSDSSGNWECIFDGGPSNAVFNGNGAVDYSGAVFHPGASWFSTGCVPFYLSDFGGNGANTAISPDDPVLDISGTPTAGSTVTLTLTGPPGAHAILRLGRDLALVPDPNTRIERLVAGNQTVDLGTIPASGQVALSMGVSSVLADPRFQPWPVGSFFAAQGEVTLTTGRLRRTNSISIVVR
jgi:hypothetical protein